MKLNPPDPKNITDREVFLLRHEQVLGILEQQINHCHMNTLEMSDVYEKARSYETNERLIDHWIEMVKM
jgi:hypothetical protein